MFLELQDASQESQKMNTHEARSVQTVVAQKKGAPIKVLVCWKCLYDTLFYFIL